MQQQHYNRVRAEIETDTDGDATIEVVAVVEGMKYTFQIDLYDLKDRDGELGIDSNDYGAGLPRHLMNMHQNGCMFLDHEETANPEEENPSLTDYRNKEANFQKYLQAENQKYLQDLQAEKANILGIEGWNGTEEEISNPKKLRGDEK